MSQADQNNEKLSDILKRYTNMLGVKDQWIATRMNRLAGKSGLQASRSLVRNWLNGDSGSIEDWQHVVTIAKVLQINTSDIEQILYISGLPILGTLFQEANEPYKTIIREFLFEGLDDNTIIYQEEWIHLYPAKYSGPIWNKVMPKLENRNKEHRLSIKWGIWLYTCILKFDREKYIYLTHNKGDDGLSIPLFLNVSLPCHVLFGEGTIEDALSLDINSGWTWKTDSNQDRAAL